MYLISPPRLHASLIEPQGIGRNGHRARLVPGKDQHPKDKVLDVRARGPERAQGNQVRGAVWH